MTARSRAHISGPYSGPPRKAHRHRGSPGFSVPIPHSSLNVLGELFDSSVSSISTSVEEAVRKASLILQSLALIANLAVRVAQLQQFLPGLSSRAEVVEAKDAAQRSQR